MATPTLKAKATLDDSHFHAGLKRMEGAAVNFGHAVGSKLKGAFTAPLSAITALAAGALTFNSLKNGILGVIAVGSKLQKMHMDTGVSVDDLKIIRDLGLELGDLKKMAPEEIFSAIQSSVKGLGKEDFGNLTRKAVLLRENAEQFQRVTVAFKMAKVSMEGAYLGTAVALAPVLEKLAKLTAGMNGVKFGESLGRGINTAMQTLYGFFLDPETALEAFQFGLSAAMKEGGNVLIAGVKSAIELLGNGSLWDGLTDALSGIGDIVGAGLMKAFGSATAYLYASIESALALLPESLGGSGEKRKAAEAATDMRQRQGDSEMKAFQYNEAFRKGGDAEDKRKADAHTALAARIGASAAEQEKIAAGVSIGDRVKRIQKTGEIAAAADKMAADGNAFFKGGMEKISGALGDAAVGFRVDDVLGAGLDWSKAKGAVEKARKRGEKAMGDADDEPPKKPKFSSTSTLTRDHPGGLQGAAFASFLNDPSFIGPMPQAKPLTGWGGSSLNAGAFAHTPILTARERRGIEDKLIAAGDHVRKAGVNAHDAIRSGDKKRAKEVERQKLLGKQGLDKTNSILDEIHKAVIGIDDSFQ